MCSVIDTILNQPILLYLQLFLTVRDKQQITVLRSDSTNRGLAYTPSHLTNTSMSGSYYGRWVTTVLTPDRV